MSDIKSKYETFLKEYDQYMDFQVHRNLNERFWDKETKKLDPEVAQRLIEIAEDFLKNSEAEGAEIKDITFTGSLANYNYSRHSDVDLHIIINFADVDENTDLVKEFFDNKKALWNLKHMIMIHGFEVEIYVQEEGEPHVSTGVYSIMNDEWITEPRQEDPEIDYDNVQKKAEDFKRQIDQMFKLQTEKKFEQAMEYADKLREKLRKFRQAGLEDEGEFSIENLVFKTLRRDGHLDMLATSKTSSYDQMMSIDEEEMMKEQFKNWREYTQDSPTTPEVDGWDTLKEYFYSFLPMVNFSDKTVNNIRPPTSSIEEVLQGWMIDDLKIYEEMMTTESMSYHVMLPTKEVVDTMGVDPELGYFGSNAERVKRRRYIVENGELTQPIIIAVGKNGKAAITWGDKHLIAAFDAGLKDVPVVFEYHTRV